MTVAVGAVFASACFAWLIGNDSDDRRVKSIGEEPFRILVHAVVSIALGVALSCLVSIIGNPP